MPDDPLVCRYLFTLQEYQRSLGGYWRMSKWWFIGIIIFFLLLPLYGTIFPDPTPPDTDPQPFVWFLIYNWLPSVMVIVFLSIFLRWQMRRVFSKGVICNREITYSVRDRSIHVVNPLMQAEYTWESFAHAGETAHGFYLFLLGRKSYHWLPKSGFATPQEIDACRDLIRGHIRKFQPQA